MDELMDLMVKDESPNQISDKIKDLLYAKTAERVTAVRPKVVSNMFDDAPEEEEQPVETENGAEVSAELDPSEPEQD